MQDMHFTFEKKLAHPEKHRLYTENEKVNAMLDRYSSRLTNENAWFSVDAYGIPKNQNSMFCEVLEMALEEATERCFRSTPPRGRYIKVRSRNTHQRLFVLISYSCQTEDLDREGTRLIKIQEMLNGRNEYFRYVSNEEDEEASIQISVPCRISS